MAKRGTQLQSVAAMRKEMKARAASEDRLGTGGDGNTISTNGKKFTFQDTELEIPFRAIIIEYAPEKRWYDSIYDKNQDIVNPPACFAVSIDSPDDLVCHDESPDPQSSECKLCAKNEFKSDPITGKGKWCKDYWKLALVHADEPTGPIAILRVSPSGYSPFRRWVRKLKNHHGLPPSGFVSEIGFMDDDQPIVTVTDVKEVTDKQLMATMVRREEAIAMLEDHGYPVENYEKPKATRSSKVSKKKTSKKKVTKKSRARR